MALPSFVNAACTLPDRRSQEHPSVSLQSRIEAVHPPTLNKPSAVCSDRSLGSLMCRTNLSGLRSHMKKFFTSFVFQDLSGALSR